MKRNFILLPVLAFISLFLTTCSKYEDGCISLRSAFQRAINTWEVEKFSVDGIDSTEYLKNKTKWVDQNGFTFYCFFSFSENSEIESYCFNGAWQFNNDDKNLITYLNQTSNKPAYFLATDTNINWEILKLCDEEMRLKTTFNNKVYETHFTHR